MPIQSQWLQFDEITVHRELDAPGVYELGDRIGFVIYIGGSERLRSQLMEHLTKPGDSCVGINARLYRTQYDVDPVQRAAELHEEHVRNHGEPPRCNESGSE